MKELRAPFHKSFLSVGRQNSDWLECKVISSERPNVFNMKAVYVIRCFAVFHIRGTVYILRSEVWCVHGMWIVDCRCGKRKSKSVRIEEQVWYSSLTFFFAFRCLATRCAVAMAKAMAICTIIIFVSSMLHSKRRSKSKPVNPNSSSLK